MKVFLRTSSPVCNKPSLTWFILMGSTGMHWAKIPQLNISLFSCEMICVVNFQPTADSCVNKTVRMQTFAFFRSAQSKYSRFLLAITLMFVLCYPVWIMLGIKLFFGWCISPQTVLAAAGLRLDGHSFEDCLYFAAF